jgi:hypothetical protein
MAFFTVGEPYLSRWISLHASPKVGESGADQQWRRSAIIAGGRGNFMSERERERKERLV